MCCRALPNYSAWPGAVTLSIPALGGQGQGRHSLHWFQLSPTALTLVISFHSPVSLSLAWKLHFSLFLPFQLIIVLILP